MGRKKRTRQKKRKTSRKREGGPCPGGEGGPRIHKQSLPVNRSHPLLVNEPARRTLFAITSWRRPQGRGRQTGRRHCRARASQRRLFRTSEVGSTKTSETRFGWRRRGKSRCTRMQIGRRERGRTARAGESRIPMTLTKKRKAEDVNRLCGVCTKGGPAEKKKKQTNG